VIFPAEDKPGLSDKAPFDRILVSASGTKLPSTLINQLKTGGTLVIPVGNSIIKVTKDGGKSELKIEEYPGFVFVKLRE